MRASGEQFGPYKLVRQIAVGGMAEIYLARSLGDAGFEKYVALKMIHPNFSQDRHFIQMLVEEAKISVYLNHVNIAHVFDLGRIGDTYYIAMEFVDGADLYHVMRRITERGMSMPHHVAAYIAHEVCAGLDYAHRCRDQLGRPLNIVHRDMSPQNVLVSRAGEIKVVDFGIAKAALRASQTEVGVIKGKYYYMSPEQAWGKPLDHRTDIFSAGVVLYEILAGQMLYLEEDVGRLLDMVRRADIPPLHTKRPDVPRELEAIVMKAVARDPRQRWQSALEFGQALEQFLVRSAPAFPIPELQRIVAIALEEVEEESTSLERPSPIEPKSLMKRRDFAPLVDHSVIFASEADYSVTDQPSPFLLDAEDDFAEATVISGPPSFEELSSRFVPSDPSLPITVNRSLVEEVHVQFSEVDEDEPTLSIKGQKKQGGSDEKDSEDSWDGEDDPTMVRPQRSHSNEMPSSPPLAPRDWLDAVPTPPPPPPADASGGSAVSSVQQAGPPFVPAPVGSAGWGALPVGQMDAPGNVPPPPPAWWPEGGAGLDSWEEGLDPEEAAALAPSRRLRVLGGILIGMAILGGIIGILYLFLPSLLGKEPGRVELVTEPSGATVEVDGTTMSKRTPVVIEGLDPNEGHTIVVKKEGYHPERVTVWVEQGQKKVTKMVLRPVFNTTSEGRSP